MPVVRGEGSHIYGADGREYLDFFGGILTISVGHCHPHVTERIKQQADTLQHVSTVFPTQPMVEVAEKMAQITPAGIEKSLIRTTTSGRIAGLLAEPIQGVGGFITPPPEYFKVAVEIVRKYGGVFICDEVQTGWGRTGDYWCGIEHWGVEPEIMTFAKGMANGMPVGATSARADVADSLKGLHISTFGGGPVSMAAALAVMEVMEKDDLKQNARVVGDHFRAGLEDLAKKHPLIGDVRGMGLMQGLELVGEAKSPAPKATNMVMEKCRDHGLIVGKGGLYGNVLRISPPLNITKGDADDALRMMDAAFNDVDIME